MRDGNAHGGSDLLGVFSARLESRMWVSRDGEGLPMQFCEAW